MAGPTKEREKHRSEDRPLQRSKMPFQAQGKPARQLLVAEGYDGVDAGGAAGGDKAGQQGDELEQGGDTGEGERVRGADAEKKAGEEARDPERSSNSQCEAEQRQTSSVTQDEAEDIAALG